MVGWWYTKFRGSGYIGNASEMRDALQDYVNNPFGKATCKLDHARCTWKKGNWQVQQKMWTEISFYKTSFLLSIYYLANTII